MESPRLLCAKLSLPVNICPSVSLIDLLIALAVLALLLLAARP